MKEPLDMELVEATCRICGTVIRVYSTSVFHARDHLEWRGWQHVGEGWLCPVHSYEGRGIAALRASGVAGPIELH